MRNIYLDCLNYLTRHCRLLRFAGLLDDDGDAAPLPPASVYHGRASEPAFRSGGGKQQQYNGARSGVYYVFNYILLLLAGQVTGQQPPVAGGFPG